MAISTAVQRGSFVYVYDENGNYCASISGDLHGFTSATVSVKRSSFIYVYDDRGGYIRCFPC